MRARHPTTLVVVGLALVVTACGGEKKETPGGGTVNVRLAEYSVAPNPASIRAGAVTFRATNAGTMPHEIVIVKTDLAPGGLPVKDNAVDEDATGLDAIGEIEEFDAGKTESATFTLAAGNYVLLCNVTGHYGLGMRAQFTVT